MQNMHALKLYDPDINRHTRKHATKANTLQRETLHKDTTQNLSHVNEENNPPLKHHTEMHMP